MLTYLRTAYYLNFLVVVGAVLSNRMATRLSDVAPIHWATPVVLALVVFVIYTVDRLLDVRKAGTSKQPLSKRHLFHRQYATLLWKLVGIAVILSIALTYFLPISVVKFGIILGGVCAAYIGAVFRLPERHPALLLKEPLVAILYAAGVWGSVWVQRTTISRIDILEAIMFLLIAFQNLVLFAVMENYEAETLEGASSQAFSLATEWGEARSLVILRWLTICVVVLGFGVCFLTDDRLAQRSALMLGLMSLTLYGIQRYSNYFLINERYRWLGDGVFWMPALVL